MTRHERPWPAWEPWRRQLLAPSPEGEGWGEGRVDQRRTIAENESEETDSQREAFLREQQRLQVLRVSNDDVLEETEAVLFAILRAAGKEVV